MTIYNVFSGCRFSRIYTSNTKLKLRDVLKYSVLLLVLEHVRCFGIKLLFSLSDCVIYSFLFFNTGRMLMVCCVCFYFDCFKQDREEGNGIVEGSPDVGLCHRWVGEEPGLRLENHLLACLSFLCVQL